MKIQGYLINLDRDSARLTEVQSELKKLSFPFQRIAGVLGTDLDPADRKRMTSAFCDLFCTPSMIGCAASHLKTWRLFLVNQDIDFALICEDDIRFTDDCQERLHTAMSALPASFDILYGGCLQCHPTESSWTARLFQKLSFDGVGRKDSVVLSPDLYIPRIALGLHCYLISKEGAQKLIALFDDYIAYHVDVQINASFDKLNILAIYPPIAYQKFELGDSSNVSSYPILLNKAIQNWNQGGISGPYVMSAPGGQVLGCVVTNWLVVLCFVATVLGLFSRRYSQIPNLLIGLLLLLIILPDVAAGSMKGHWHFPISTIILYSALSGTGLLR